MPSDCVPRLPKFTSLGRKMPRCTEYRYKYYEVVPPGEERRGL